MLWSKRPMIIKQAVVVMFALSVLFSTGCSQRGEDPRTKPELVRLYDVEAAKDADPSFTGVVTARVQSDLGFRVSGKVTRRFVDAGQTVLRGQPLMRID